MEEDLEIIREKEIIIEVGKMMEKMKVDLVTEKEAAIIIVVKTSEGGIINRDLQDKEVSKIKQRGSKKITEDEQSKHWFE